MIVPVVWKSYNPSTPARGYWDQGILEDLFSGKLWRVPGIEYSVEETAEYGIVVLPARSNGEYVDQLNKDISSMKWVILMLTGDEENVFPIDKIEHDNIQIYVMSPREDLDKKYKVLGTGYPSHIHESIDGKPVPDRSLDWFFAGQVTHERRELCVDHLNDIPNGKLIKTGGFTQGESPRYYYKDMMSARTIPCPSGPETPDTFRLFEALEIGCVPIADTLVSKGGFTNNYWSFFFGEQPPFPIIEDYSDLHGYIVDNNGVEMQNKVYAWWQQKKRQLAYSVYDDIKRLSGSKLSTDEYITVIIPTSPIKSNPSTHIIEETIRSVRKHLPTAEIIITFDGVREEQEDRRDDYNEFTRQLLWRCNNHYDNIMPILFKQHTHQVGMAREALKHVSTNIILYCEQDTPLVYDEPIEWKKCIDMINSGDANIIRFHFEAQIPEPHKHMMIGGVEDGFLRTMQWSQRPHLASKAYYDRILNSHFSNEAICFIEDKMHGVVHEACIKEGLNGWFQHRLYIYHPEENIKRSYHTDGRAGEKKWDSTQKW